MSLPPWAVGAIDQRQADCAKVLDELVTQFREIRATQDEAAALGICGSAILQSARERPDGLETLTDLLTVAVQRLARKEN